MKKNMHRLSYAVLAGALGIAAGAPVAMRVEVEPLRQSGNATEVMVVIQVSPEDRGRIGENIILRVEMDGGTVSSGSPMRALRLEDDGSARFTVAWPPGQHDLRVQIEDRGRQNTGLWVGKVRIPDLSPQVASAPAVTEPVPAPEAEPSSNAARAAAAGATATAVTSPPVPKPAPETVAPEAADTEGLAHLDSATTAAPPAEPEVDREPAPVAAATAAATAGAAGGAGASESSAPIETNEPADVTPEVPEEPTVETASAPPPPIEEAPPVAATADELTAPAAEGEGAEEDDALPPAEEPEDNLPIVEPLRSDTPPAVAAPEPTGTEVPPAVTAPGAFLPAEAAARIESWQDADPGTRDISVVVMAGREPVLNLQQEALRLRVGGSDVPIEKLGGAESAPLLLGLAVDVASGKIEGWMGARGSLAPLAARAAGGRGELFVATENGVGDWGAEPESDGATKDATASGNVARLVIDSLRPFDGRRGRTFLVVLTDGRNEPSKSEWAEASEAASSAGVPILVVALWDDAFSHRTRKNLKDLTVISGGSLFLVQGSAQLDSAADRFGRQLDGSYALRFRSPAPPQGKAISISVTAGDRGLEVSAPKSIR